MKASFKESSLMLRPEKHGSEPKTNGGERRKISLMNENTTLKHISRLDEYKGLYLILIKWELSRQSCK